MIIRLACMISLMCVFVSEAAAWGPGCDYESEAFRAGLQERDNQSSDADDDLILYVPVCLQDLDLEFGNVLLTCSVFFSQPVTYYQNAYSDWDTSSTAIDMVILQMESSGNSSAYVDAIVPIAFNMQHRAQSRYLERAECELKFSLPSEMDVESPLPAPVGSEPQASEIYRTAAPDTPFRPVIRFNSTRTVERHQQ